MKIICTQENLHKGLNLVSHIANKSVNLPILNNVLIKAKKNGLTLITTDLEIGTKVLVRGKVETEGEFTVDAKLMNNFVSLLPRENIELCLNEGALEIKSANQETSIKGMEPEDFPLLPEIEKKDEVELPALDFKKALSQVVFAASLDNSRLEINSINLAIKNNQLILAATDSYRLAERKMKINSHNDINLIIPLKTVQELLRILSDQADDKIKLYFNENQILFSLDNVELISRVIDGRYPDYQQIIPEKFGTVVKCESNKISPAIKAVSLFCKQGINDIKLSFDNSTNEIIVSTASAQTGKSIAKVSAQVEGENNDIVFNFRYLLDGLNNLEGREVVFRVNNNASPGMLQSIDSQDYLYLVMPIRQ